MRKLAVCYGFLAIAAWSQSESVGQEPSPMEAFSRAPGVHIVWSAAVARLEQGRISAAITALELADGSQPARQMRGVMVELSDGAANDKIYLGEEATERTRAALIGIAEAVARRPMPNGCMGAKEFWPLYGWPWNKFHELNADYCQGALVLSARGRQDSFRFPGDTPDGLAAILANAMEELKRRQ